MDLKLIAEHAPGAMCAARSLKTKVGGSPMKTLGKIGIALGIATVTVGLSAATAHDNDRHERREIVHATLVGYNEVAAPPNVSTLSTPSSGRLWAEIDEDSGVINFVLTYQDLTTPPLFAHIHLGQRHTAGGVMVFLCGGGSKPACPAPVSPGVPVEVRGSIIASDVIGPTAQGIDAGQFDKVLAAIRAGAAYANVHTTKYPTGEIRGQVSR
jgi:hypothetical protein